MTQHGKPDSLYDVTPHFLGELEAWLEQKFFAKANEKIIGGGGDTLYTIASSGSALTINFANGDVQDITLTANCTFTLTGFANAEPDFLTLVLHQDGVGGRTVTWPTITWIGTGIPPILHSNAGDVDSVVLFSFNAGTTVYGVAQTSASGLRSGTSFPGGPADGDLFYRTDRNILYFYKSSITSWLSVDLHEVPMGAVSSISTTQAVGWRVPIDTNIYVESWVVSTSVATTNNGTNYWTLQLFYDDLAGSGASTNNFTTASDTASQFTVHKVSVATTFSTSNRSNLYTSAATITGTPGNLSAAAKLLYRTVG